MAQRLRQPEEARRDVADYLLTFYNQKRLNSALGNMSPAGLKDNASSNLRLCRLERLTLSGCSKNLTRTVCGRAPSQDRCAGFVSHS